MRDQLNLVQLAKQARRQRLWGRTVSFFGILMIMLTILLVVTYTTSKSTTYQLTGNRLQPVKDLPGTPLLVKQALNGNLWVQTEYPIALNRYSEDAGWKQYKEFGSGKVNCICDFTIDNDVIWVATDKGISRFDGKEWNYLPDAPKSYPVSIAASVLGLFVVDSDGNLSRYVDNQWATSNLRDILPKTQTNTDETETTHPILMAEQDGNILLKWNGIWYFDGDQWSEMIINNIHLDTIGLIGVAWYSVWTEWGGGIAESYDDGSDWRFYKSSDIGVPERTSFYQVIDQDDEIVFVTSEGTITFDGENWRKITPLNKDVANLKQVSILPDKTTWFVADNNDQYLAMICLTPIAGVVAIIFLVLLLGTLIRNRRQLIASQQLLRATLADYPPPIKQANNYWPLIIIIILLAGMFIWPLVSKIALPAGLFIIVIAILFLWFVNNMTHSIQSTQGRQYSSYNMRISMMSFGLLVVWIAGLFIIGTWISRLNSAAALIFSVLWIVVPLVLTRKSFISLYQNQIANREYDKALEGLQTTIEKQPLGSYMYWFYKSRYGEAALISGRLAEAESDLKSALINMPNVASYMKSNLLTAISSSIMYQGRYEEALKIAEVAIQLNPTAKNAWTNLATLYLYNNVEPERSLEAAEFGKQYGVTTWYEVLFGSRSAFYDAATYAWALARVGQMEIATTIIDKLSNHMPKNFRPAETFLYFIKGKIEALKGNSTQAAEWYQRASQSDKGLYGQLAETALKNLAPTS